MKNLALITGFSLIVLSPAAPGALQGIVYSADGQPSKGATVWATITFANPRIVLETTTDAEGRFTLDLFGSYRWTVRARKGRQSGEANDRYGQVQVEKDREPGPVIIRMAERGVLRGEILEAETGRPIPGGQLWLDNAVLVTADERGEYEFQGLELGDHSLRVLCLSRERLRVLYDTSLRPEALLDLRVQRAGKIRGVVLDEQGRPIPGARVYRATSGNALANKGWCEVTDLEGRFEWDGAAFGASHFLTAVAFGYAEQEEERIQVTEGQEPPLVTFRLQPKEGASRLFPYAQLKQGSTTRVIGLTPGEQLGSPQQPLPEEGPKEGQGPWPLQAEPSWRNLGGIVLSPEGKPLRDALVRWGATQYEEVSRQTYTGKDGRFSLEQVPDRPGYITVMAAKFAPAFVRVAEGQEEVEVSLEQGQTVGGVVQDEFGNPVDEVTVIPVIGSPDPSLCNPLWLDERKGRTDTMGRFQIEGLPRYGARFDFLHADLSELRNQSLLLGDSTNVVRMQAGGAIRGRVVDPEGQPVREFRILIQIPHRLEPGEKGGGFFAGFEGIGITFTSPEGTFVVSDVNAGHIHRVVAVAEGYGEAAQDRVEVQPMTRLPRAEELTLQLTAPHSLIIRVVEVEQDRPGKPLAGAKVVVLNDHPRRGRWFSWMYFDRTWNPTARGTTDTQGRAAFPSLHFDRGLVAVQCPGYGRHVVDWLPGISEVVIPMDPEAVVTGVLRSEQGYPLASASISLRSEQGDSIYHEIKPADQGRFRVDQLATGDYTLTVSEERHELYKKQFSLQPGQTFEFAP